MHLTINNATAGDTTAVECNDFSWYGNVYSSTGTYTHNLTNVNGCDSVLTLDLTINEPDTTTENQTICQGSTYSWYGTDYTIAGTYYYDSVSTITGCDSILQLVLNVNPLPVVDLGADTNMCNISSIILDAQNSGSTFIWSNDLTTPTISVSTEGSYSVTVTNAFACENSDTIEVSLSSTEITSVFVDSISCNGNNDAAITINATGGETPYQYTIDGVTYQASNVFSNLSASNYAVKVKDASACVSQVNITSVIEPEQLVISSFDVSQIKCNGANDGAVSITAIGGTTPYQYSIDNQITYVSNNQINSLGVGVYSLYVKDNHNCIVAGVDTSISQPDTIIVSDIESVNLSCNSSMNGSISIDMTGGIAPYEYSVDTGATYQTDTQFVGLSADNYIVQIRDANMCIVQSTEIAITQPNSLLITNIDINNVACYGEANGRFEITVSGGTQLYEYSLDNGQTFQTENIFENLNVGSYTPIVRDINMCTFVNDTVFISEPNRLTVNLLPTDASCYGMSDGSVVSVPEGGTAPYSYLWDDALSTADSIINNIPAFVYYHLTTTDNLGCLRVDSIMLNQPAEIIVDLGVDTAICQGSYLYLNVQNPGAEYLWNDGSSNEFYQVAAAGTYHVNVTVGICEVSDTINVGVNQLPVVDLGNDIGICVDNNIELDAQNAGASYLWSNTATTPTIIVSNGGDYSVIVTDANQCSNSDTISITINQLPIVDLGEDLSICMGDIVQLDAQNPGAEYLWSNDSISKLIDVFETGEYNVLVTDVNGCENADSIFVLVNILPVVDLGNDTSICEGGSVILDAGTSGVSYSWNTGSNSSVIEVDENYTYTVTVVDINQCSNTDDINLTVNIPQSISFTGLDGEYCANENISILEGNPSGGTFVGGGISGGIFNPSIADIGYNTIIYSLEDINGCASADTQRIIVNRVPYVDYTDVTNSNCGQNDGSVAVYVIGGYPDYYYQWEVAGADNFTNTLSNVSAGVYMLKVTDDKNCSGVYNIVIDDNDGPTVEIISNTNTACPSSCEGTATALVTGGTAPYSYSWTSGEVTIEAFNLCLGENNILVKDANNCIASASVQIESDNSENPIIYGTVSYSGGVLTGEQASLHIFSLNNHIGGGYHQEIASWAIASDGSFALTNFPPDDYILKVKIEGEMHALLMNSYYKDIDSTYIWEEATPVHLSCGDDVEANIVMVEKFNNGQGNGHIGGSVFYPNENAKSKGERKPGIYALAEKSLMAMGEPVPGAEVFLELEPDEQPIANTESDTSGSYSFDDLSVGSYGLKVEIPGFDMISSYSVDVTDDDTLFIDRIFIVDTTVENPNVDTLNNIADYENNLFSISVYPNPFKGNINITYSLNKRSDVSLEVYNIQGIKVDVLVNQEQFLGDYKYNFSIKNLGLKPGTYLMKLTVDNITYLKRIIGSSDF